MLEFIITIIFYPLFFLLIIKFLKKDLQNKIVSKKLFYWALHIKLLSGLLLGIVFYYYYGTGDTVNYYLETLALKRAIFKSPSNFLKILSSELEAYVNMVYNGDSPTDLNYYRHNTLNVIKFGLIPNILSFGSYFGSSLFYSAFAFIGSFQFFKVVSKYYTGINSKIFFVVFLFPSVAFWGAGITKDSICLGSLLWLSSIILNLIWFKTWNIKNTLLALILTLLILNTKAYIIFAFLPSMALLFIYNSYFSIKNVIVKFLVVIFSILFFGIGLLLAQHFIIDKITNEFTENLANTVITTQKNFSTGNLESSTAYDLGPIDPSINGLIKKAPNAIFVTLFRPFVWEYPKPIVLVSAIEASFFLILFVVILFKRGFNFFIYIFKDPFLLFCIIFTLVFSFFIGLTTYNFGSLVRYKIPCLPFFGLYLLIIYYKPKKIS